MEESLTPEQQADIIVHKIMQATKDKIISILEPQFNKIADDNVQFDKKLADSIITDIKNS